MKAGLEITPEAFSLCFFDFARRCFVIDQKLMAIPAMLHFPVAIEITGIAAQHKLARNSGEDVQQLTMLSFRHFECIFTGC